MATSGPRRPTLEDVAARAGVSRALVSIVLRDVPGASAATRARVRAVAEEIGYQPDTRARLLAGRRTRLLGVTLTLNNPFHADVAEGIYATAEGAGFQIVLSAITPARPPARAIETLLSYRCEAAILVGALVPRPALAALAEQLPVVVVGQPAGVGAVDVVRADDAAGMRVAVDHLVGLGHRRLVHLDGGRGPGAEARRRGFTAAVRRHGGPITGQIRSGGEREQDGAASARRLIAHGLPDAIVTYNDRSAVGLLDAFARERVAVPDSVSVVGYDDSQVARLPYLALTTVSQDTTRLARLAVERAIDRVEERPVSGRRVILTPHLVTRATTAAR